MRPGLGQGWKISPSIVIEPGETFTLADIEGPGAIQQIWMTLTLGNWRHSILRIYWDDQEQPSVECPVGDFFASGWEQYAQVDVAAGLREPRQRVQLLLGDAVPQALPDHDEEHRHRPAIYVYYQINYTLTEVPEDAAYFHAQFRRTNPLPYKEVYTILDGVKGQGHYVGTYMAWGVNNNGWWGEGEIKFYMDGDGEFPTICGTGTEDYFCGSYNFDRRDGAGALRQVSLRGVQQPYAGLPQVIRPDGVYQSQQRFGLYRWHIMDPVRFEQDLRVTIQALGWRPRKERQYLPLQDDIASVAFWYQTLPTAPFPPLPDRDYLEVI